MVKGTLLGPEPSTFSSQRAHCLSASRLAPLRVDLSFLSRPCPHSFNFLSFPPILFFLGAPFHPFISLVNFPSNHPTCFYLCTLVILHRCGVSFILCPCSLCHWSIIGTPWHSTDLSFITSISSPPVLLSLCILKPSDVPSASWMFSNSPSPFSYQSIYPCQQHGHMFKLTTPTRFTQARPRAYECTDLSQVFTWFCFSLTSRQASGSVPHLVSSSCLCVVLRCVVLCWAFIFQRD